MSAPYERWWQSTMFMRESSAIPGSVYVFGNPVAHLFSERPSASAIHGWAWELQPAEMWTELASHLAASRPAFIFVATDYEELIRERGTGVRGLLDREYEARAVESGGRWYERRERNVDVTSPLAGRSLCRSSACGGRAGSASGWRPWSL